MTAPRMTVTNRAACDECGRPYQLNRRGLIYQHPRPLDMDARVRLSGYCDGSGRPPRDGDHE